MSETSTEPKPENNVDQQEQVTYQSIITFNDLYQLEYASLFFIEIM